MSLEPVDRQDVATLDGRDEEKPYQFIVNDSWEMCKLDRSGSVDV